jgi:hypothetical protein
MGYLEFMENPAGEYRFPPGDYSPDQICRDVEGIILHETQNMADTCSWRQRLEEFRRRRQRDADRRAARTLNVDPYNPNRKTALRR